LDYKKNGSTTDAEQPDSGGAGRGCKKCAPGGAWLWGSAGIWFLR